MPLPTNAAALSVDLSALKANYRLLKSRHAKKSCAAVVKANAYGLGMEGVAKALWEEGCREFFVATLEEGAELRGFVPEAWIGVFSGPFAGEEKDYAHHRLTPTLNDLGQVERAERLAAGSQRLAIHVDTGMTRLGLSETDVKTLSTQPLVVSRCELLMSHLACADDAAHPKNAEQLSRFKEALKLFPNARASMANSAGIFLDGDFHFDLARPGCALYGINPVEGVNPMRHVATLSAPILQLRTLDRNETVGYDATATARKGSKIAIAGMGYSDGYFRSLSNTGFAYMGGHKASIVGRISMDMMALDVSEIPEAALMARAEFINEIQDVNAVAAAADTIGYEVFTRIGRRVKRVYV